MNLWYIKPWVILLSCWILFVVLSWNQAEGCEWKLYHQSDDEFYFYDFESITKSATLKVSERSVRRQTKPYDFAEAVKEVSELGNRNPREMTDEVRKKTIAARAVQETRRLYEIQCQEKMVRVITGMEYDKEETLIDAVSPSKWEAIRPNSIIERLYQTVCP